jgi:cellulose synthase/poly-beta-1,6-N-acetylglucosamine synthase-like glycosyltransferase
MISIIVTSFKEPKTIGRAIESITSQNIKDKYEVLVIAPDDETLAVAKTLAKKNKVIKTIKDAGNGKPAALNLAVSKAVGDVLVLTDGDVYISKDSINSLIMRFNDKNIGAVSGRPISSNSQNTRYGFWSYILTEIAHERRQKASKTEKRFFCSGYLFAIRKNIFPILPEELLSEDGYISHKVYKSRHLIAYSPTSMVYVKYPTNFSDWIIQKKRSAGGYNQIRKLTGIEIRSFKKESSGAFPFLKFATTFKKLIWLIELFFARIYLWYTIYKDIDIKKKSHKEIWKRVESTK